MDRYSLTWASLGVLGLMALAAWWQAAEPSASSPPLTSPQVDASTKASGVSALTGWAAERMSAGSSAIAVGAASAQAELVAPTALQHEGLLSPSFVSASLRALAANGVRLQQPQVSLHTVQTVDLPTAHALGRWARTQGFTVRPPVKVLEHGGEVNWVLPIERHAVLEEAQILADGASISQRARQSPGARYHAWQVPVDGRSTLAGAAQS